MGGQHGKIGAAVLYVDTFPTGLLYAGSSG
jgi:hypothetical protein